MKTFLLTKWHGPPPPDRLSAVPEHRIAVMARQEDWDCVLLATMEKYSVKTIARITHLTCGQVRARLRAAGVRLTELREGKGPYASLAQSSLTLARARQVKDILREQLTAKLLKQSE